MSDREKLVELAKPVLTSLPFPWCTVWRDVAEKIADAYIAHGVTVKEWVSVNESPKENGIYCVMVENHKNRNVKMRAYARYRNGRWLDLYDNWENRCWHVTHWMPLPELPKEEEHKNADTEAANGRRSI